MSLLSESPPSKGSHRRKFGITCQPRSQSLGVTLETVQNGPPAVPLRLDGVGVFGFENRRHAHAIAFRREIGLHPPAVTDGVDQSFARLDLIVDSLKVDA